MQRKEAKLPRQLSNLLHHLNPRVPTSHPSPNWIASPKGLNRNDHFHRIAEGRIQQARDLEILVHRHPNDVDGDEVTPPKWMPWSLLEGSRFENTN